jgi:hypothetical protein
MLLRAPTADDVPFVTSGWLNSYRRGSAVRDVPNDVYYHHEQALIQRLWRDKGVTWLIGCHPSDTTFAYGFLCGEATDAGPVLHYTYVKGDDRKFGVAGELLEAFLAGQPRDRAFYTHKTPTWDYLLKRSSRFRMEDWLYNPWLAWSPAWR